MLELLTIIYRWKWHIAIICGLALLASIIFSGPKFLPPYFESTSIFYPSNPAATDRATLFSETGTERQVSYFGTKSDLNRMLTLANSAGLANYIIQKHDLVNHYDVDANNPKHMFYVAREFRGNYEAIKTERDALLVRIYDQDPTKAANMVNDVVKYIDDTNNAMIREGKTKTLAIFDKELKAKKKELVEYQANRNNVLSAVYTEKVIALNEEIAKLQTLYDQYKVSADEGFTSIYLVETASPALTKSKPVRWMIVALTGLASFFISILLAIFLEKFKEIKENA